eukprot:scaffold45195_cov78-Cyclotella_meneghiniana.AAC.5
MEPAVARMTDEVSRCRCRGSSVIASIVLMRPEVQLRWLHVVHDRAIYSPNKTKRFHRIINNFHRIDFGDESVGKRTVKDGGLASVRQSTSIVRFLSAR